MKLIPGGLGGEGGGWQGRPGGFHGHGHGPGHGAEDFENMNLANFLGVDHSEQLGWSPSATKAVKVNTYQKRNHNYQIFLLSQILKSV